VSVGKGHLAEAKAIIASPAAGARGAFSRPEPTKAPEAAAAHVGTFCGGEGEKPRE